MPTLGASAVVITQDNTVLLVKREDIACWSIPGGAVDPGESVAQAAIREVKEETHIDIRLTRLVGIYSRPNWAQGGDHSILFAAEPLNKHIITQPTEVIDAGFFPIADLPTPILWWHHEKISDTINGVSNITCIQDAIWPFDPQTSHNDIRNHLAESNLSKPDYYHKHFTQRGNQDGNVDVGTRPKRKSTS